MTYQLRPVTSENERDFFRLMRENMAEFGANYDDFHEGYDQMARMGEGLLYYQDEDLVGAAVMLQRDDGETYLSDVFISREFRHQDHGRNLVQSCEKLAEHFGQKSMGLICEPQKLPFYEAMGYEQVDVKKNNHLLKKLLAP